MKSKAHKIIDCKLIKVEKLYNQSEKNIFYYNLKLEGIEDLLLVETNTPLEPNLIGHKIRYQLNEENEVSTFDIL